MPDTKPMSAAELLRLADELAEAVWRERDMSENAPALEALVASDSVAIALGKWLTARAASPVTLEEHLLIARHKEGERLDSLPRDPTSADSDRWFKIHRQIVDHARTLAARAKEEGAE